MNSASEQDHDWRAHMEQALAHQGAALGQNHMELLCLHSTETDSTAMGGSATRTPVVQEPKLSPPERYGGEVGESQAFLTQCEIVFEMQPSAFPTERAKVAYALSLLTGRARKWGMAEWMARTDCCFTFADFGSELTWVFNLSCYNAAVSPSLMTLSQGSGMVVDYITAF